MGRGKVVSSEQIKKSDRDTYWVEVDGSPVAKVPLRDRGRLHWNHAVDV